MEADPGSDPFWGPWKSNRVFGRMGDHEGRPHGTFDGRKSDEAGDSHGS
jgi:hypothetical protein